MHVCSFEPMQVKLFLNINGCTCHVLFVQSTSKFVIVVSCLLVISLSCLFQYVLNVFLFAISL